MNLWHGYPQAPGAHPERPWWVRGTRSDGWAIRWGLPGNRGWFAQDPKGRGHDLPGTFDEAMAAIEREHPLPCPEPRCGQVWVWPEGAVSLMDGETRVTVETHIMVLAVGRRDGWWQWRHANHHSALTEWPPPGAVLVAGPGAPWAPA